MTNDRFKEYIYKASKIIEAYTYPLLHANKMSLPDIFASCLFVEVGSAYYLVTAAHAVRGNEAGLQTRGDGTLIDVVGRTTISSAPGADDFDIAAIRVDKETIIKNKIKTINKSMFASQIEVTNPHSRAVSGFLASMNKQAKVLNKIDKSLIGKCFTYFGDADFHGNYSIFNKSPDTHIGIEFMPGTDDSGKYLSTPPWPPRGISGGGAWLIPDMSQPELVFLEGIFIEGHKRAKKKYAFSTQLIHVIDFINDTHKNV